MICGQFSTCKPFQIPMMIKWDGFEELKLDQSASRRTKTNSQCSNETYHNHHQQQQQQICLTHHSHSSLWLPVMILLLLTTFLVQPSQQTETNMAQVDAVMQSAAGSPQATSEINEDKRASGFLPMRGRKSSGYQAAGGYEHIADANIVDEFDSEPEDTEAQMIGGHQIAAPDDELELLSLLAKRSQRQWQQRSAFMPMRGRKSMAADPSYQSHFLSPAAQAARLSYYGGAGVPSGQQSRFNSNQLFESLASKRGKGVAFFGSRGKRSLVEQ